MAWSEAKLERLVAKLRDTHAEHLRTLPPPEPGAPSAPLPAEETPYETAHRELGGREQRLAALADLGDLLLAELLPPPAPGGDDEALVEALRGLQRAIFRHPMAFRGAYAGLVADGRRFAETPEGAACRESLRDSPLLPRLRLFGKMLSFSMLEEDEPERLPSGYLEGVFRLVGHPDADAVLDRLFGGTGDDDRAR